MRGVMIILLAVGCALLTACSSNLGQSLGATSQPKATSIDAGTRASAGTTAAARAILATVLTGDTVPYEIVAEGDPMVGAGQNPATVAWRPGEKTPEAIAMFPDEAQTALEPLRTQTGSDLYIAIYGGLQPSSGFEVKIISMTKQDDRLQVVYQVAGPPPGQGGATVMTHPYVVARVADTTIQPTDVVFVEQKVVR